MDAAGIVLALYNGIDLPIGQWKGKFRRESLFEKKIEPDFISLNFKEVSGNDF